MGAQVRTRTRSTTSPAEPSPTRLAAEHKACLTSKGSSGGPSGLSRAYRCSCSSECVESISSEVRVGELWKVHEKGLGARRVFDEGLQVPHDPLRPLPVHQVARISVHPQGGIGYVATRYTLEGTHEGELFGIPPTGQQLRIKSISVERVSDSKIREHWRITDTLDMMQQLGVIPMPQHALVASKV